MNGNFDKSFKMNLIVANADQYTEITSHRTRMIIAKDIH